MMPEHLHNIATAAPLPLLPQLRVWILVASGGQAEIYSPRKVRRDPPSSWTWKHPHAHEDTRLELEPISSLTFVAPPHGSFDRVPGRHSVTTHPSIAGGIQEHLIRRLAAQLEDACVRDAFDKLLLVAQPGVLTKLRQRLSDDVRSRIVGEVHKNLIQYRGALLLTHLGDALDAISVL